MNYHFATIGDQTAKLVRDNQPPVPEQYLANLPDVPTLFTFQPITTSALKNYVRNLPESAPGEDGITAKVLKLALPAIVQPLTDLINDSLRTKTFPAAWKKAIITPIYKSKGVTDDPANYRPLSLPSVTGKLAERVVTDEIFRRQQNPSKISVRIPERPQHKNGFSRSN